MNGTTTRPPKPHSVAWIAQVWIAFVVSVLATAIGVLSLPIDGWAKGFVLMGLLFSVGSTLNLAKTTRDLHDGERLRARVEEAKMERLLAQQVIQPRATAATGSVDASGPA